MGGGKGSFQQQSSFQPPPWALAGGQQSEETAAALAQTPFAIPVQPIAGLSPQQQEAMQTVENTQGMFQPYANAATGLEFSGARPDIGKYFGAESAGVLPELQNIFGQQMAQTTGNATQTAGGVGAERVGITQAELANQQGLSAGQTLSEIMRNAVSQSQAGAGLEEAAGQNIAGIGKEAQGAALQGATAELQAGTLAQQQQQNQLNSQYENILQQISWPFQTNQYLASTAAGVTPAMGGTGITSGNVKSSMLSGSSLGKGAMGLAGLLDGGASRGGVVDGVDDETSMYIRGPSTDAPTAFGPEEMQGGGTADGFSPLTGQTIEIPFGPAFGGPQALTLTGGQSAAPAPRGIVTPTIPITPAQGTENLNVRGAAGAPSFSNPFLSGQNNGFSGLLDHLFTERASLMSQLPSGDAAGSGAKGKQGGGKVSIPFGPAFGGPKTYNMGAVNTGMPTGDVAQNTMEAMMFPNILLTAMSGNQAFNKYAENNFPQPYNQEYRATEAMMPWASSGGKGGGGTGRQSGGSVDLTSMLYGKGRAPFQAGGEPQRKVAGDEVGPLLGESDQGIPAIGAKGVIPVSPVQGRPSPQMQELMKYKGPDPMSLAKQAAGQGSGQQGKSGSSGAPDPSIFQGTSSPFAPTPSADTMNQPGVPTEIGGGKMGADPTPTLQPPASPAGSADLGVQGMDMAAAGVGDVGAAGTAGAADAMMGAGIGADAMAGAAGAGLAEAGAGAGAGLADLAPLLLLAADGGGIWLPPHMDIGGDPFADMPSTPSPMNAGMGASPSPFTPQGEIAGSVLPFNIASSIYAQGDGSSAPQTPGDRPNLFDVNRPAPVLNQVNPNAPPTPFQGAPGTQSGPQMPVTPTEMETAQQPYYGRGTPFGRGLLPAPTREQSPPTPPLSVPPTRAEDREQNAVSDLKDIAARVIGASAAPFMPPPQPPAVSPSPAPTGPAAPGAAPAGAARPGSTPPGAPPAPTPGPPPAAGGAFPAGNLLNKPVSEIMRDAGYGAYVQPGMEKQNLRDMLRNNPTEAQKYLPYFKDYLAKQGVTPQQLMQTAQVETTPAGGTQTQHQRDVEAIKATATRLGMDPTMLAEIMHYETGLHPWSHNPTGSRTNPGEVAGVIGFDEANRRKYFGGPELDRVTGKSIADQMPAVERYFRDRGWKPGVHDPKDLARAYSIVNHGGLLPNGEAALDASDVNGTVRQHVANISKGSYGPANDFLNNPDWKEGVGPPTRIAGVSRETPAEPGAQPGAPTQPSGTDFGPPPGFPQINPLQRFIGTLVSGDPSFWEKNYAQRAAAYSAVSDWGIKRDALYGDIPSQSPQQAGASMAGFLLNDTRKMAGTVSGTPEQNKAPGTLAHAADSGISPPGATVEPVGGAPVPTGAPPGPGGGPSTTPLPPSGAAAPSLPPALAAMVGNNPPLMRALQSRDIGMQQRGIATLGSQLQAANIGWRTTPFGLFNPLTNQSIPYRDLIRSMTTPGGAAPISPAVVPGPGTAPTPPTGAPSSTVSPFLAPPGAPGAAPPTAGAPSAGAPLPSGAGPETIVRSPSSAPVAQTVGANMPIGRPVPDIRQMQDQGYFDDRIAYPIGGKLVEATAKKIEALDTKISADYDLDRQLAELEKALDASPTKGVLARGTGLDERSNLVRGYNTFANIVNGVAGTKLPLYDVSAVGSIEEARKLNTQLGFNLARTLGAREAQMIIQQAINNVPSGNMTPQGARNVLEGMRAGIQQDRDRYNTLTEWTKNNLGSDYGFEGWFTNSYPSEGYVRRAEAISARSDSGRPIGQEDFDALTAHPETSGKFDRVFHTPGLGGYYLRTHRSAAAP